MSALNPQTTAGPSDFSRLHRGRRMPIQFHADIASRIYSGLALGLFAHMAMMRDGEEFSLRQMQRTHKEGRDAWSGALAELLELGLVARIRWADGRGQWRTRYYLAQDHPFDEEDIAYIREVHGKSCLIECSPELSNVPIQVSSRVSKRPRKQPVQTVEGQSGSVRNSVAISRDAASELVAPVNAIAAAGDPSNAIAATGATSSDSDESSSWGVAAIAGTNKERRTSSFPPPLPPHSSHEDSADIDSRSGGRDRLGRHPDTDLVMPAVLRTWPTLSRTDQKRVDARISHRLVEGYSCDQLRAALTENPGGAKMPGRLLLHRLDDLGHPASSTPAVKPWCGACDYGWMDHGRGLHRCSRCNPGNGPDCPGCTEAFDAHTATHGHVDWCGSCSPAQREIANAPCPICHPLNTRSQEGVA